MSASPELAWVADCCLRIDLRQDDADRALLRVHAATTALRQAAIAGVVDVTPAYATVLLTFALADLDATVAEQAVREVLLTAGTRTPPPARDIDIPVCYEGACALDLEAVAAARTLPTEQVVALHSGARYSVAFLGFSPGFPYLVGLPTELSMPRLPTPRVRVPWGSVAIAGAQAGIYPQATAGGWRILGRTPLRLFDAERDPPALLQSGDRVRFVAIDHATHVARAATAL